MLVYWRRSVHLPFVEDRFHSNRFQTTRLLLSPSSSLLGGWKHIGEEFIRGQPLWLCRIKRSQWANNNFYIVWCTKNITSYGRTRCSLHAEITLHFFFFKFVQNLREWGFLRTPCLKLYRSVNTRHFTTLVTAVWSFYFWLQSVEPQINVNVGMSQVEIEIDFGFGNV